jgi:hypothetical protein
MSQSGSDKPKKIMTAEMLKNLELAREKARIKRKEQGELNQLKKELARKTTAEEIETLKAKLGQTPKPPPGTEPEIIEDEEPAPVKTVKKKSKKPIVIVEQSESESDDEQVVYIRRKSSKPPKHKIVEEEALIPDERYAPPPPQVPQSPYHGLHPSMLSRRRF